MIDGLHIVHTTIADFSVCEVCGEMKLFVNQAEKILNLLLGLTLLLKGGLNIKWCCVAYFCVVVVVFSSCSLYSLRLKLLCRIVHFGRGAVC
jgi:hypothetical protein